MEIKERTLEQVQKQISAAFDSVNLITSTVAEPSTEKKKGLVKRNVDHCKLMLTKSWFVEGLTDVQKTQIEAAISAGETYSN
jgi:hypothetical protein